MVCIDVVNMVLQLKRHWKSLKLYLILPLDTLKISLKTQLNQSLDWRYWYQTLQSLRRYPLGRTNAFWNVFGSPGIGISTIVADATFSKCHVFFYSSFWREKFCSPWFYLICLIKYSSGGTKQENIHSQPEQQQQEQQWSIPSLLLEQLLWNLSHLFCSQAKPKPKKIYWEQECRGKINCLICPCSEGHDIQYMPLCGCMSFVWRF